MSETTTTSAPRADVLRTRDFVGWPVTGREGGSVGTVSDLLIDRNGRVRYLAVDRGLFKKYVLVPVEILEWGEGALVAGWTDAEVKGLPPYDPDVPLSNAVLEELARAYPRYYHTQGPPPPPISSEGPRVVPLKEARDFKLAKGAPNLRGWTVYGSDNEKVGTVVGMLVDPVAMKIAYLDVDLDDDLFALRDDRHVILPMESVDLRERSEDVWVSGLTAREIAALPAYTGGAADPLVEEAVARAFGQGGGNAGLFQGPSRQAALPPGQSAPPPLPPVDAEYADTRYDPDPPPLSGRGDPPPLSGERPPIIVEEGWVDDEERGRAPR